jgi:hypothetical protein
VWQKYKTSFPTNSFIFNDYVNTDFDLFGFVLFHKSKVSNLYSKHKSLMDSVFMDIDHIQDALCHPQDLRSNSDSHSYHQALGLLLGYNQINVERFRERFELIDALARGPFALEGLNIQSTEHILSTRENEKKFCSKYDDFSRSNTQDMIQQLNLISSHFNSQSLSRREPILCPIGAPILMAFEDEEELIAMQEEYDKIQDLLVEIYFSDHFLETILLRLQL